MERIETTLQDAVQRCARYGGRFRPAHDQAKNAWIKIDGRGRLVLEENEMPFYMWSQDFDAKWIYEPPQQSAFQKWHVKASGNCCINLSNYDAADYLKKELQDRKQGWNAFGDELCEYIEREINAGCVLDMVKKKIKELKEP